MDFNARHEVWRRRRYIIIEKTGWNPPSAYLDNPHNILMNILWNTWLISISLLLPNSTAVVLAQSCSKTIEKPVTQSSTDIVIAEEVSPAQPPPTLVVPVLETQPTTRPAGTTVETSGESTETIVIPNPTPYSTPSPATAEETPTPTETESSEDKTRTEEATDAQAPKLSPEELARQEKLIQADQLLMSGQLAAAQKLYRAAKEPFPTGEPAEATAQPEPIYDAAQLPAAGAVYWRMSGEGLEQKLKTKIFVPLESLVERFPQFIPGHLRYAQALKEYEQPEKALQVLERASSLYPKEPELLKATIAAMGEQKKWLEASLTARQFALLNPDHPQSSEFSQLADENLERYRNHMRRELRGNAIANAITGALGFVFTGNLFGPISAIDSTVMLLRGESAVGESVANQAKRQLPLMEDEEVLNYVREVGNKLALVAGRKDFEYEFYVVMDDRLNAFALPGGKVFVNAGTILKTRSEAELAGLLAHELAHAALSHGFQLVTQGNLIANITQYIPLGGTAANLIVLDYSREMERQADALGTRILAASGYAADGLHNLMVTLEKEERDRPLFAWLSTHPDTKERTRNIETLIQRNGYNRYTYEGVSRHVEVQKRVAQRLKEYKEREKKD